MNNYWLIFFTFGDRKGCKIILARRKRKRFYRRPHERASVWVLFFYAITLKDNKKHCKYYYYLCRLNSNCYLCTKIQRTMANKTTINIAHVANVNPNVTDINSTFIFGAEDEPNDIKPINQTTEDFPFQTMKKRGYIRCVRIGYIIVDIPKEWKIKEAEVGGHSLRNGRSYYDIALNGRVLLHIYRCSFGKGMLTPFFFEEYPL